MKTKLLIALFSILTWSACNSEKDPIEVEPIYNLDDIEITVDETTVMEGEEVTFTIAGRGDRLTFFSGEPGHVHGVDQNGGVSHTGRIDFYTYLFNEPGVYDVVFVFANNNGQERVYAAFQVTVEEDPDKEPEPEPTDNLKEETVTMVLGPRDSGDETFFVDLGTLTGYSASDATAKQGEIDILAVWSRPGTRPTNSEGWPTFYVIGAASYGGVGIASPALDWTSRNEGKLIRLDNPTQEELDQFETLSTPEELEDFYENLAVSVQSRPGWDQNNNGPFNSISFRDVVDQVATTASPNDASFEDYKLAQENHVAILYFKSESRNVYAAFKVSIASFPTAYGNSINATLELEAKSFLEP